MPYVWRINTTIFWGAKKVQKAWLMSLSSIYGFFYDAKKLIDEEFPHQIKNIAKLPKSLFRIFFGAKSVQTLIHVNY